MIRPLITTAGFVGLVALAGVWAAEPTKPPAPAPQAAVPVEVVLLGEDKITRVQIQVEVDGKPVAAIWDETFAKLFAFFDRNEDGVIDAKEAANLPAPLALRQAMGTGFTPPTGAAPTFAELDADNNGKVTPEELAAFYRRTGVGDALIGVGKLPTSAELTDALLKHLDTDRDGKVTEKEWRAAADSLAKLDKNDDELIGVGELVPKSVYPGAAGTVLLTSPNADRSLPDVVAKLPLVRLPADRNDTHWATEIVRHRDRNGDGKLSATEAGLGAGTFAKLDADRDGFLTAVELAAWRKHEPDARWVVRVGTKTKPVDRFTVANGGLRLEGWVGDGKIPESVASTRRQFVGQFEGKADPDNPEPPRRRGGNLAWLTPVADRNGDGKLDRKELDAWLDLQQQVAQGQVLLTIIDGGGLFELLDTNHDGALSVRELRGAWDRVREAGCAPGGTFDRTKLPRTVLAAASHGYPQAFGIDMRGGPAWFRAMDKNGDGDVSRKEFTGPPEVFDKLDLDKDGLLSAEEASKADAKK